MKKVGLYVHIPFCKKKCFYCDFNSYENCENLVDSYIEALIRELSMYTDKGEYQFKTIFIGGGTPTLINSYLIRKIIENVRPFIQSDAEISIECNPGTADNIKMKHYFDLGINRISIGLQAWQDSILRRIGRIHTKDEFLYTLYNAKKAGFKNINIDLMFSLPYQSKEEWEETLREVIKLDVEHISCYSLKLEEGTKLYELYKNGIIDIPNDETDRDMYKRAIEILEKNDFYQYEISNFSKPNFECKHNLIYWKNEEYIGVGTGSHSKIDNRRFWNCPNINQYIKSLDEGVLPQSGEEFVSKDESMWETIILGLRLNRGINIDSFEKKYNIDFINKYGKKVESLISENLVTMENGRIFLTPKGRDLSNKVFIDLM